MVNQIRNRVAVWITDLAQTERDEARQIGAAGFEDFDVESTRGIGSIRSDRLASLAANQLRGIEERHPNEIVDWSLSRHVPQDNGIEHARLVVGQAPQKSANGGKRVEIVNPQQVSAGSVALFMVCAKQ